MYSTVQYPARVKTNVFVTFCVVTVVSMFLHALHDRLAQCFRTSNVRPGNSFFGRHLYIYISFAIVNRPGDGIHFLVLIPFMDGI